MNFNDEKKLCSQKGCNQEATHRYTWPGKDESYACEKCVLKLHAIADAMGMYLQIIPLGIVLPEIPEEQKP